MSEVKQNKKFQIITLAILILIIVSGAIYYNSKTESKKIVARVGDEVITKEELYESLVSQNGKTVLDLLISEKIIDLELKKHNIEITEESINDEVKNFASQYGGEEAFEQALAAYGFSIDNVRTDIEKGLKLKKLLESDIQVTEEEMEKFFEENKEEFAKEEQVKASHILVESGEEAKEIREKILAGKDFAEMASEHSMDISNKDQGGNLGYFTKGDMVKEFEEAAFSLELNKISEPIKTEYGYHIIKVEEKLPAKEATYEESKEQIKDILLEQKLPEVYESWFQEKHEEYKIEILL